MSRYGRSARGSAVHQLESLEQRRMLAGWTFLTNLAPSSAGTMMLLPDGTVMAQGGGITNQWMRLTPSASGSYVNGTWSSLAPMALQRLYFASNVLPDGRVFLLGGEYSGPTGTNNWTNTGEIYNSNTNTWANLPNFPQSQFGDVPSMLLPDGRILCGSLTTAATFIYNPATNSWAAGGTKLNNDRSDEETWIKLADDSVLSYNVFGSPLSAQRYIPATNSWTFAGTSPVQLQTSPGSELGPALRIPDGRAVFIGGTNHNAIYSPTTNTWASLPDTPGGIGANDAPGALLPNGHILYAAGDISTSFNPPTSIFDLDPIANTITPVSLSGGPSLSTTRPYTTRMLMLPTGQVLFSAASSRLYVYTPDGAPQASWRPVINTISRSGSVFTITGSQLNGISAGASYGDDAEMDENYPIVRFTSSSGQVYYAKSFNWNANGVASGGATSVQFSFATAPPAGNYTVNVIGAGISSADANYTILANGIWTGNGDGVNWSSAANWTNSTVPGPADNVVIDSAANPVVVSGFQAVKSVTSAVAMNITGTLVITDASSFAGPVTLSGVLSGAGSATFSSQLNWTGGSMNGIGSTIIASTGSLNVAASGASVSDRPFQIDGLANVVSGGDKILVLRSIAVGAAGKLDLTDNAMIIDYAGPDSPIATIGGYLTSGYAGGAWYGPGIDSSTAAATPGTGVGYAESSDLYSSFPASFLGQSVDSTSLLIRHTLGGDTDLDHAVGLTDFTFLAANFNGTPRRWSQGDFNYDGLVDLTDFTTLAGEFNLMLPAAQAAALASPAAAQRPAPAGDAVIGDQHLIDIVTTDGGTI